ncbi:DUF5686 family protein [Flavobacterium amniphilum]|uniref:DUF5686 family protein n=1 Tax=Flavobacterium amniphilum TaxID=1834035 RepID=UPI002029EC74|nr:DUF5686 family protein [Flavobacterium amniphilum]MCL9806463.1 DUF5686 family protein [Flavobacterium amniphilum]
MSFNNKTFWLILFTLVSYQASWAQDITVSAQNCIKNVIIKAKDNNQGFETLGYSKLIITANPDLVEGKTDSIFKIKREKKTLVRIDSSDYNFKKRISKQHLYQTEKLSRFYHQKNKNKEQVLATKMAGFKEPVYEYFALQLQPFSPYETKFTLAEKDFTSPVTNSGLYLYDYTFEKDIQLNGRKVLIISFKPKSVKKNNMLTGKLFIDAEKFSIAKMQLQSIGIINVSSVHEFSFDEQAANWFPSKSTLTIKKGKSKNPVKILGETITFEGNNPLFITENKKNASDFIEIRLKTKYYALKTENLRPLKTRGISVEISERAIAKKENLWYAHLNDTIDLRSNPTYVSVDSLVEAKRIENKIRIGRKIIKGYYPVSFFDFDLRYLFKYNNYEGIRIGLGGVTNEKLSKYYKIETYGAYGTKDGFFKGMLSNSVKLNKKTETWLGLSYKDDVSEIANTGFEIDKKAFKIYDPRPFNISTFYNHETWRGFIETKFIPKTESVFQITQSFIEPKFNYHFLNDNQLYTNFRTTLFTASIQWNPFSKYMQTPNGKVEIEKRYPKFTFQLSKSIPNLWRNDFDFGKLDFRLDYHKKFNSNHKLLFLAKAQYAFGDVPLTHLYNHSPNNLTKDKLIQRLTFAGHESFETMYFNEFFSNRLAFFQLEHQFPKLEISRQIKPIFSLVSRYGIGSLDHREKHLNIPFKTLEKGFMESGFELNQIFKGIGFNAFYRYGPNQLPRFEDNLAIKLSVQINLGFND